MEDLLIFPGVDNFPALSSEDDGVYNSYLDRPRRKSRGVYALWLWPYYF
jgi:hypothetical protein